MPASQGNNGSPLVSVIIPTYNSARYVGQAVQSALAQTETRREVIVVDDGSTDGTRDLLRKFGGQIKYLYQENRGPSAARNAGIKVAKGKYICFLDADDLWASNKLELQLSFMERRPDVGLVFSHREDIDESKALRCACPAARTFGAGEISGIVIEDAFTQILKSSLVTTSTAMVRKDCFEKAGLFDESLRSVEDRDMWMRVSARFRVARLPLILCKKRFHDSNISSDQDLAICSRIRVLENNRQLFPGLAPSGVWNKELAKSYMAIGYSLLIKNWRKEARHASLHSLKLAPTLKALELLVLSFMSPSIINLLRQLKASLRGRIRGSLSKSLGVRKKA